MLETIGNRIASLRQKHGWTQQTLAARLAISRVAISHIETDLIIPSERTVTLLAGLFKITPHALVEGTSFPRAKAERLPLLTCCYTQMELELALLENDLEWLSLLESGYNQARLSRNLWRQWRPRLNYWIEECTDGAEKEMLSSAYQSLREACHRV